MVKNQPSKSGDMGLIPGPGTSGFPGGSVGRESASNAGDPGSIPSWDDPLEKEMATHPSTLAWRIPWHRGAGQAEVHGVGDSDMTV